MQLVQLAALVEQVRQLGSQLGQEFAVKYREKGHVRQFVANALLQVRQSEWQF